MTAENGETDAAVQDADSVSEDRETKTESRVTAPMQSFDSSTAGVGALVLVLGVLLAYVVPYLA